MNFKVTALTPVLVGDGKELSPIDYMVWKDQVNVLDQARIFRLLARGPRLEGYLGQLKKASKLDFASWGGFAQNFSQRRIPFEHAEAASVWNGAQTESLFIPTFAANYSGPYLPASAIKGALRTGLVFSRWSEATIEKAVASMEGNRLPRRTAEAAESAIGASQMRLLSMADSESVPSSAFKIYLTRVASLDTRGSGVRLSWKVAGRGSVPPQQINQSTPSFAEMAAPGTVFSGGYTKREFLEQADVQKSLGWRSKPEVKTILEAANSYAAAQLQSHASYAETIGLPAIAQIVNRLQDQLKNLQTDTSCLLCLGWGGGFTSKTAVLGTESEAYQKVLRSVPAIGRSMREGVRFPKTRRIVFTSGQPASLPGWVRLDLGY